MDSMLRGGPHWQKDKCTRLGKRGHVAKVGAEGAAARAIFLKNNASRGSLSRMCGTKRQSGEAVARAP